MRRQIILPNTGHGIPLEQPDAIVNGVRDIMTQLHNRARQSSY
ncbi:MAG TPA: hypothetical protein VHZ55_01405 [Bryobacteraceae bacterium]|jgi:pimeloyl-ACP methyl ester carboxylesterase|nr:hypothetical protein [Bryobacteraceae bacterium]